jgi:hypothetical protein
VARPSFLKQLDATIAINATSPGTGFVIVIPLEPKP